MHEHIVTDVNNIYKLFMVQCVASAYLTLLWHVKLTTSFPFLRQYKGEH